MNSLWCAFSLDYPCTCDLIICGMYILLILFRTCTILSISIISVLKVCSNAVRDTKQLKNGSTIVFVFSRMER